jgi:acyl-CoA dehydrogenase
MAFPDHLLDDTHKAFRATCRRFAEAEILPHAFEWEEAEAFPRELYAKAAQAGILGVGFPESCGGSGGDILHMVAGIDGLLRGGSTGVIAGLGSLGIALPPIVKTGTAEQIERFVRPALEGRTIAALAITEPGTGSDVAGVQTRATRDGSGYVIRGSKTFITSGARADLVVTLCRTSDDPHRGLTFFAVESTAPGFSVSRTLKKTGWRASDTAELYFDDVHVGPEHRVGPEGSGFLQVMANFQNERLALAAYGVSSAAIALEEATRWAKERRAFGKPLTGFQVTRHKLAEMATQVQVARTFVHAVAARVAQGENLVAEVSMAKNFASTVARDVCWDAVQILGGMGYMRESVVERLNRDVRLLPIGGGTHEIMNEIITKLMHL